MFLRNYWYVAAFDREVAEAPLARKILGEASVFWRARDGAVVAMQDRCPHRRAPLSMGKVLDGERLQCLYHGMEFDRAGACARIPGQADIPPAMRAKTYPVVVRYRWVWVWMGDPAAADPSQIPEFPWLESPDWGAKGDLFHVKASWTLIVDNLLDLTHLATVHATTIGNAAIAEKAETRVERTEKGLVMRRWVIDAPAPPTYVKAGGFTANIDRWQFIDFTPPAFLRLHVGGVPTGTGAPDRLEGGIHMRNLNAITPETETTTHYFWAQAHDFQPRNEAVTDLVFSQVKTAFLEDVAIFEAQQRVIDNDRGPPEVDVRADAAQIQARRILERLEAGERSSRREAAQ